MRDGALLATEVYLPEGSGPFPVVLQRSPYNRYAPKVWTPHIAATDCTDSVSAFYAARGYVALLQDVRGRYRSQGEMSPMFQEENDGYDTIEWAAAQSWSNGRVGMVGGSYLGLTQLQAAVATPPHLAAIVPAVTASDYHDHWTYVNGVFDLWFAQSWMFDTFGSEQVLRNLEADGLPPADVEARASAWVDDARAHILTDWVWQLPLVSFPEFRAIAPYYYEWLAHPTYDAFWSRIDLEPSYARVTVPVLNVGGWYDVFQIGTVRNFRGIRAEGGSASARAGTKLVMNCCGHSGNTGADGAMTWGASHIELTLRFLDRYLKGEENGIESEPAVQLDVLVPPDRGMTGTSFLVVANDFPLPGTESVSFYLSSGGHANTRNGDGELAPAQDARTKGHPDRFTYDPRNPVPTVGGNLCCNETLLSPGAHDQASVELRDDVLVYTSAPLEEDLAVIGPVTVKLWAKTSARDTDFTAKLVDVHLDGIAHNVLDRIIRARYRWGSKLPPSLVQPGKPYEYTIDLGNAGTVFRKGHRIRLEISSSSFPHFARNLNTGLSNEMTADIELAHQTVMHDGAHPSRLVLPVVRGVLIPPDGQTVRVEGASPRASAAR